MAKTQTKGTQILDDSLTGADLATKLGFYDETKSYVADDEVWWLMKTYKVKTGQSVTGGTSGDLSNSPDLNTTAWEVVTSTSGTPYKIENTATTSYLGFTTNGADANILGHTTLTGDTSIFALEDGNNDKVFDVNAQGTIFNDGVRTIAIHKTQRNIFIGDYKVSDAFLTAAFGNTILGNNSAAALTTGDYNVSIGDSAGSNIDTQSYNVSLGYHSGVIGAYDNTISIGNTAIAGGYNAIAIGSNSSGSGSAISIGSYANNADTGSGNIAIGTYARRYGTSGTNNILLGTNVSSYTEGDSNVVLGYQAAINASFTADNTVAIGKRVAHSLTSGLNNILIGTSTGYNINTGGSNIGLGTSALSGLTTGTNNIGIGVASGATGSINDTVAIGTSSTPKGTYAIAIGNQAKAYTYGISMGNYSGYADASGLSNINIGYSARRLATKGNGNIVLGYTAGYDIEGAYNIIMGYQAAKYGVNTTGNDNIIFGRLAGRNATSGDNNIILGKNSAYSSTLTSDSILIGEEAGYAADLYNSIAIGYRALSGVGNNDINYSVAIGHQAGYGSTGNSNIFLGYMAGYYETGDSTLIISNQQGSDETTARNTALFYGIMGASQTLLINAKVTINDILNIKPRSSAPSSPAEGDIYTNSTDNHIYCYLNSTWKQLDN